MSRRDGGRRGNARNSGESVARERTALRLNVALSELAARRLGDE